MNSTTNPNQNDFENDDTYDTIMEELSYIADKKNQILTEELGIYIPENVYDEDLPIWDEFLETVVRAYINNICDKKMVSQVYEAFIETEDSEKRSVLDQLKNLVDESIDINETNMMIRNEQIIENKINKILPLLTPEEQILLIKNLYDGKLPPELEEMIRKSKESSITEEELEELTITPEEAEEFARNRLAKVLSGRKLNSSTFNTPLTVEEITGIVDEHNDEEYGQDNFNPNFKPTPLRNSSLPQDYGLDMYPEENTEEHEEFGIVSLTNSNSQRRPIAPQSVRRAYTQAQNPNDIPAFPQKKSPSLDDLLHKDNIDQN